MKRIRLVWVLCALAIVGRDRGMAAPPPRGVAPSGGIGATAPVVSSEKIRLAVEQAKEGIADLRKASPAAAIAAGKSGRTRTDRADDLMRDASGRLEQAEAILAINPRTALRLVDRAEHDLDRAARMLGIERTTKKEDAR